MQIHTENPIQPAELSKNQMFDLSSNFNYKYSLNLLLNQALNAVYILHFRRKIRGCLGQIKKTQSK